MFNNLVRDSKFSTPICSAIHEPSRRHHAIFSPLVMRRELLHELERRARRRRKLDEKLFRSWYPSAFVPACYPPELNSESCSTDRPAYSYSDIILQTDLSEIGSGSIPEELAKNLKNAEKVSGPAVYQIQRIRNVSAPKSDQDNERDNKMLRIYLTDGVTQFSAVLSGKSSISVRNTCPGTKILLNPQSVPVCNGIIILSERLVIYRSLFAASKLILME